MLHRYASIRYLGAFSGVGVLMSQGEDIGQAAFDFEIYMTPGQVMSCAGEFRLLAGVLQGSLLQGSLLNGSLELRKFQLLTETGRLLELAVSGKENLKANGRAYVDVSGDVPTDPADWRH